MGRRPKLSARFQVLGRRAVAHMSRLESFFFHGADLWALIIRGGVRSEDLGGVPYDTIAEREGASPSIYSSLMWIMSSERIQYVIARIRMDVGDLMMLE